MSHATFDRTTAADTTLIEALAGAGFTAESANRELWARGDTEHNAAFGFRDPESFDDYTARELSEQVESLLRALSRGRETTLRGIGESFGLHIGTAAVRHPDAADRRFHAALAACLPTGISPSGLVVLAANLRLDEFRIRIDANRLADTDAAGFLRELAAAHRELLRERRALRAEVTRRHRDG